MRVLLVEDDRPLAAAVRDGLTAAGFAVDAVTLGATAREFLRMHPYECVVLDLGLPDEDGLEILHDLRRNGQTIPVLVLTARAGVPDRVAGLVAGADDYLPKPFDLSILLARLQGLLRRSHWMSGGSAAATNETRPDATGTEDFGTFSFNGKTIDFGALELRSGGQTIRLTLMESDLLRHLVRNDGRIVSRKQILEEVWGLHEDTDTRAIDNFVVRLRRYIEDDPANPQHLLTVRGVGYRFLAQAEKK
jgi:DNA-binding response OmpR family regulator